MTKKMVLFDSVVDSVLREVLAALYFADDGAKVVAEYRGSSEGLIIEVGENRWVLFGQSQSRANRIMKAVVGLCESMPDREVRDFTWE